MEVASAIQPCDLTSAVWSTTSAIDGDVVTLTVAGTGDCTGEAITFDIYEDDPFFDDFVTTLSDTYDSTTWTAHWTYVGDDDLGDDPRDYYFEATVDSNGNSYTSGNMEVARLLGTCTEEGGVVCGTNYYCPSGSEIPSTEENCCQPGECELSSCVLCSDCDNFFTTCSCSECHSCTGGNCYYDPLLLFEDCVTLDELCSSRISTCEDYDGCECTDDPCGLGDCRWSGSACFTVTESSVYRSFSSTNVAPGGSIDVMLDMYATNKQVFLGEERIPSGWTITADPDSGSTPDPNILRWYTITSFGYIIDYYQFSYTVQAPASTGSYLFDGIYFFDIEIVTTPVCGNGICEISTDNTIKEPDSGTPTNPNIYFCPQDCEGDTTLGSTTITVA